MPAGVLRQPPASAPHPTGGLRTRATTATAEMSPTGDTKKVAQLTTASMVP